MTADTQLQHSEVLGANKENAGSRSYSLEQDLELTSFSWATDRLQWIWRNISASWP